MAGKAGQHSPVYRYLLASERQVLCVQEGPCGSLNEIGPHLTTSQGLC